MFMMAAARSKGAWLRLRTCMSSRKTAPALAHNNWANLCCEASGSMAVMPPRILSTKPLTSGLPNNFSVKFSLSTDASSIAAHVEYTRHLAGAICIKRGSSAWGTPDPKPPLSMSMKSISKGPIPTCMASSPKKVHATRTRG